MIAFNTVNHWRRNYIALENVLNIHKLFSEFWFVCEREDVIIKKLRIRYTSVRFFFSDSESSISISLSSTALISRKKLKIHRIDRIFATKIEVLALQSNLLLVRLTLIDIPNTQINLYTFYVHGNFPYFRLREKQVNFSNDS